MGRDRAIGTACVLRLIEHETTSFDRANGRYGRVGIDKSHQVIPIKTAKPRSAFHGSHWRSRRLSDRDRSCRNVKFRTNELYPPIERSLRELDIPVLVAWGDRDPFFAVRQAQRTASAARLSRLSIYANARHFLPGERPAELAADIRRLVADAVG
jgi:pimeloyl-ACP methyl ester carboxylesterase